MRMRRRSDFRTITLSATGTGTGTNERIAPGAALSTPPTMLAGRFATVTGRFGLLSVESAQPQLHAPPSPRRIRPVTTRIGADYRQQSERPRRRNVVGITIRSR